MMDVPFHRMRMWDDDADNDGSPDGLFGAPNIVTVTGVVVSVATLGAGAGVSLAATIATNAAFTVTDIATGYADADDALGSFAKSTAVSLASAGMAKGFDQLGTLAGKAVDGSRAITQTAVNVGVSTTQAVATTAMSSAINSFSIDASFDMDFDERGFRRSTFGESAVAGYAGGAAQGLAQSGFGSLAKMDDLAGFSREHMGAVNSLVSLGANAVGAAVDYAVDREVAINVLNVGRMLGIEDEKGNALSAGALEMNLGGNGALFNVGSGGYDIGVDLVANGMMGANVLHQRARIDRYIEENTHNAAAENTLRATWSFGKRGERSTYGNILEGVDRLHLTGAPGSEGARAQTIAGGNGKDIYLGAIGDSLEEQLVAASVLSHESYRDGIADGDNAETVSAVTGHTEFAMRAAETYGMDFIMNDANLAEDVNQYLKAQAGQGDFAAYAATAYDSSADYWKLTAQGELIFDGRKGVYDENDELLREFEGEGGYAASLAEHLGITEAEANQMMIDAGWTYENGTFTTNGGATDVKNDADHTLDPGAAFKARYFMQRDYIDNVGAFGGSMVAAVNAAQESAETDFMTALRNGTMTPEIAAQYEAANSMEGFAQEYDAALYGQRYGSFGAPGLLDAERNEQYSQDDVAQAFGRIRDEWSLDNNNPMYELIGDGRVIDPIQGRDDISTFSLYEDGREHGWGGGEAIDLRTFGQNHPLFTTQEETVIVGMNPLGWDNPNDPSAGYGLNLRTRTPDFDMIYGHLQPNTRASNQLNDLLQAARATDIYRFTLPPGYQFGNVGNTGNSTGPHLHWEFRPRW